jgi:hypothetical protein
MKITKDNYEAWFLDYHDQSLNPGQTAELMLFLEQHPELKAEFDAFEQISLVPDLNITFPEKENLKKNEIIAVGNLNETNYEEYLIAAVEKVLTATESTELDAFLAQNPHLYSELALFRQTVLEPDLSLVFEDKDSLKRKALIVAGTSASASYRRWLYPAVSIAALLLIFFAVYININPKPDPSGLADHSLPAKSEIPAAVGSPQQSPAETGTAVVDQLPQSTEAGSVAATQTRTHPAPIQSTAERSSLASLPLQKPGLFPESPAKGSVNTENRSYFTDVYAYIRLREEMDYQQYQYERENKPVLARAFSNFKEKIMGVDMKDAQQNKNAGLWALAEAGLDGINFVTRSNLQLNRRTDDEGHTLSYAISSNRMEYSKAVKPYQEAEK